MHLEAKTNRLLSPKELAILQNAQGGITKSIPLSDVSKVVKSLCKALKLGGTAQAILDFCFGLLKSHQFEIGKRAVCWPSNNRLANELCADVRTIERALKNMSLHGLITFKDSPNNKRFPIGDTGEGFGIDFTPAWNNFDVLKLELQAFKEAAERHKVLGDACKTKRKTALNRDRKLQQVASDQNKPEIVSDLQEIEKQILAATSEIPDRATRLEALQIFAGRLDEIEDKLAPKTEAVPAPMPGSTGVDAGHLYNTSLIPLNKFCGLALEDEHDLKQRLDRKITIVKSNKSDFPTCQSRVNEFDNSVISWKTERILQQRDVPVDDDDFCEINLPLLRQALPNVVQGFGFDWQTWQDVENAVFAIKHGLGLSDDALAESQLNRLHRRHVAIALAVVLEMALRGKIQNAGGYARWLLRRSGGSDEILMPYLLDLMRPETVCH